MKLLKKVLTLIMIVVSLAACGQKEMKIDIKEINKRGNIILDVDPLEMGANSFNAGDIVTIKIGDFETEMPIGTSYSDVDAKEMIMRFDLEDNEVVLAINGGDFASTTGMFVKETIEEEPGFIWNSDVASVSIAIYQKEGYIDEYHIRNLKRSLERKDYPNQTDEQFANFRTIKTTGIKEGIIYRSSSPVDPELGRNTYVDALLEKYAISSAINMDDSLEEMHGYDNFNDSYYSTIEIVNLDPEYNYGSETYNKTVKEIYQYLIDCPKPCVMHCKEGKDRTGLAVAILELALGGTYQEAVDDYMLTYENYYGVTKDSDTYKIIVNNNFDKTLKIILGVEDLNNVDLLVKTHEYLNSIGLSDEEIGQLQKALE